MRGRNAGSRSGRAERAVTLAMIGAGTATCSVRPEPGPVG